jgi:hypothetical protein
LFRGDRDADDQDRAYGPVERAVADAFARMASRQMMVVDHQRQQSGPRMQPELNISVLDGAASRLRRVVVPPRELVLYAPPERFAR